MISVGMKYGRWSVIAQAPNRPGRKGRRWLTRCECGSDGNVPTDHLLSGHSTGCTECRLVKFVDAGQKFPQTHGMTDTRLYRTWGHMKDRCYLASNDHFKYYGGRGITVCDEWRNDFVIFRDWALSHGYEEALTIERRDVNGNYSPDNCLWIPRAEQARNRTDTVRFEYQGKVLMAGQIAERCGISETALRSRLQLGWSMDRATTVPVGHAYRQQPQEPRE